MTEQIDAPTAQVSFLAPPPSRAVTTPTPEATWDLRGGTAWVFYGKGNTRLTQPVVLAEGFASGETKLDEAWAHLERPEEEGGFPFATALRGKGRDLIILGFKERSASILDNAEVASRTIRQANAERVGSAQLIVGGFSMGGLVTRYALAKLEFARMQHDVAVYLHRQPAPRRVDPDRTPGVRALPRPGQAGVVGRPLLADQQPCGPRVAVAAHRHGEHDSQGRRPAHELPRATGARGFLAPGAAPARGRQRRGQRHRQRHPARHRHAHGEHIIYAIVLTGLAITAAGNTWGLGKTWANLGFVKKNPWLR